MTQEKYFGATGLCLFVRSSHYFEVNGLDEDFFAHQEIDLCWRLKTKDIKYLLNQNQKCFMLEEEL